MRVLIIGASGFIGTHLIAAAARQGMEVVALSRSGLCPTGAVKAYAWSFGQPVPDQACDGVSCVVYLAHDFAGEEGARRTFEATLALASQLQAAGIERQIFFSSYSAGTHAASFYGQTKYALEQALAVYQGLIIVRPGLVLGNGGIYGRIRNWAQRLSVLPLPGGGRGKVPVIEIEKLCRLTLQLVSGEASITEANLFEHELKSLRELVLEVAAEAGHQPLILPVSATLLISILALAARLHIPLPVNADNLAGFIGNQSAGHISSLTMDGCL